MAGERTEDFDDVREQMKSWKRSIETMKMLHEIEEKKCIYNVHYCNAGIGFSFYEGPNSIDEAGENWRNYLSTDKYYPTFEDAVKGEWDRIK